MRTLNRNKQKFTYCLLSDNGFNIVDENNNRTGEIVAEYSDGIEMSANISPATGASKNDIFGDLDDYDKVIVTDDMSCPIDETSVLFIDNEPDYASRDIRYVVLVYMPGESNPREIYVTAQLKTPLYDYVVKRVAKSLNSISIAVSKVRVG